MAYRIDNPRGVFAYYTHEESGEESLLVGFVSGFKRLAYPSGEVRETFDLKWESRHNAYNATNNKDYAWWDEGRFDLRTGEFLEGIFDESGFTNPRPIYSPHTGNLFCLRGARLYTCNLDGSNKQIIFDMPDEEWQFNEEYEIYGYWGHPSFDKSGTLWWASGGRVYNYTPGQEGDPTYDRYLLHNPADGAYDKYGERIIYNNVGGFFNMQGGHYLTIDNGDHVYGAYSNNSGLLYRRPVGTPHGDGAGYVMQDPGLHGMLRATKFHRLDGGHSTRGWSNERIACKTTNTDRRLRVHDGNHLWGSLPNLKPRSHRIGKILGRDQPGVKSGETVYDDTLGEWVAHDDEGVPIFDDDGNRVAVSIVSEEAFGTPLVVQTQDISMAGFVTIPSEEAFGDATVELKWQFIEAESIVDDPVPSLEGGAYGQIGYGGYGQDGDENPSNVGTPSVSQ